MTAPFQPRTEHVHLIDDQIGAEVRNHIGYLTLNRPEAINTLTLGMVRSLQGYLEAWATDPHVQAVVLRGSGSKGFCAGGDIRGLYDAYIGGSTLYRTFFAEEYALDLYLHGYRKPVLALMDGYCLGGGMGLAQACELRVVTERSRLGMPETAIGYFPDVGASYFLSRLPGEIGLYLGLTGNLVHAQDALYAGLADWHVASEALPQLLQRLDTITWSANPLKDLQGVLAKVGTQQLPTPSLAALRPAIDHFFSLPDVSSMVEQLRAVTVANSHNWAESTAALLETRSPVALEVTLEMLRRGRRLGLAECFALESHLGAKWFEQGDLVEGIRALLVDKDKCPRWNPTTLRELSRARVDAFFEGL